MVNDVQRKNILNQIRKEINKRSFFEFIKWAAPLLEAIEWKWNFHHQFLADKLQKEIERKMRGEKRDRHLIINVPFRSSKSLMLSILMPLYAWTLDPSISFINLSYSQNLSNDHSNKIVAILNHPKFREIYGEEFEFVDTHKAKNDFQLKNGATRIASSVLGTTLGRGANFIILDDPNSPQKLSDVERKNTIDTWKNSLASRLNDMEIDMFILVQQRLHSQDMTGYLLEVEGEDKWEQVCLPAELSSNVKPAYLVAEYKDNLLWGERFNRDVLNRFKTTLGSVGYSNQLQQEVSPEGGNHIQRDWIPITSWETFQEKLLVNKIKPKWDMWLDSAQTEKKKNDPSGILICCKLFNDVYVRKVVEKRLTMPDLLEVLKTVYKNYNINRLYIEPKSNGKDIIAMLKRNTTFNVIETPSPSTDKTTRLNAVAPTIEGGRMILIEDISNETLIDQLIHFPNVSHDEFVDLTGYALSKYIKLQSDLNYLML